MCTTDIVRTILFHINVTNKQWQWGSVNCYRLLLPGYASASPLSTIYKCSEVIKQGNLENLFQLKTASFHYHHFFLSLLNKKQELPEAFITVNQMCEVCQKLNKKLDFF